MNKHTEGNWIVRKGSTAGCEVIAPEAPKTRQRVAQCGGKDREANARIIAAAPDLLAALRTLVIESGGKAIPNDGLTEARNAALLVIAKAEGQPHA